MHHFSLSIQKHQKADISDCCNRNGLRVDFLRGDVPVGEQPMNDIVFQNRLRVARAEKRISQGDLAEMVGVSRQTISSIENNQFCPSARLALLICIALDKKFEELFYFE